MNEVPQTVADFTALVAEMKSDECYRAPKIWAVGAYVKTANGTIASVR